MDKTKKRKSKVSVDGKDHKSVHPEPATTFDSSASFDGVRLQWSEVSSEFFTGTFPPPVSGHSLCTIDNDTGVLFGGIGPNFIRSSDVYVFRLSSRTVTKHSYTPKFHSSFPASEKHHNSSSGQGNMSPSTANEHSGGSLLSRFKKVRKGNSNDSSQDDHRSSLVFGPLPRERHAVCAIHLNGVDHMVLFGGISDNKLRLQDVWFLNMKSMRWVEAKQVVTANQWPPSPRYNLAICALSSNRILMFGGYDGNCTNDLFLLKVSDDYVIEWNLIRSPQSTDQIPEPRYHHACTVVGNKMILVGGKTRNAQLNDVWMFDPDSYYWSRLEAPKLKDNEESTKFSPRHGHQIALIGSRIVMYGGVTGKQYLPNTYMCDLQTLVWTECALEHRPPGRISHSMCVIGANSCICIGGIIDVSEKCFVARSNDMWMLETNINSLSGNIPFVNERRVNDYVIERLLGKGGQGSVFLCRNTEKKNELYALKRIVVPFNNNMGPERMIANDMSAFNEVLVTQAVLDHPNVLKTEKFFMELNKGDFHLNIVMPYCSNGDLENYMKRRRGKIHESELISLMLQIVSGVVYVHSRHVIHRDLKPSNVLCAEKVGSNSVILKLADFGLAKNTTVSEAKTVCGTLIYASPEVYNNEPYDHKADIWSLGVILVWLMTGRAVDLKISRNRDIVPKLFADNPSLEYLFADEYVELVRTMTDFQPASRPEASVLMDLLSSIQGKLLDAGQEKVPDTPESSVSILASENFPDSIINNDDCRHENSEPDSSHMSVGEFDIKTPEDFETHISTSSVPDTSHDHTTHDEQVLIALLADIMRLEEIGSLSSYEADDLGRMVILKDPALVRVFLAARTCHKHLSMTTSFDSIFVKHTKRLLRYTNEI